MNHLKYRYAPIEFIVQAKDGLILLEEKGVDDGLCYKINSEFKTVWEKKIDFTVYFLGYQDGRLKIHDGSGEADLDADTGEITNWVLKK